MTLLSYLVFKTAAASGSFYKTAEILGLTPSAISHTVSNMEKELGFAVFYRGRGGISLTNSGQQLLPYVNNVLNAEESLQQVIAEMNGLKAGLVKIGVFSSVCTTWLPDILYHFQEKYPEVEVEVFQGTYDDVREWLKTGQVDLGFLSVSSAGEMHIEPLQADPLVCVVPAGSNMDKGKGYMAIEDIRGHGFVYQRESTDADIQKFLKENQLEVVSRHHVVDDLSTVKLVEKGFGICLMPALCMQDIHCDVETYPIRPEAGRIIGIAVQNPNLMAPAVRMMYNYIVKTYKEV
ncbi:MAG: LysR family transcriptional regulator [Lachnospiraceae bacterium]|nr:LysR family transcriptional regulator [Candidatus Equihabitans merdae]